MGLIEWIKDLEYSRDETDYLFFKIHRSRRIGGTRTACELTRPGELVLRLGFDLLGGLVQRLAPPAQDPALEFRNDRRPLPGRTPSPQAVDKEEAALCDSCKEPLTPGARYCPGCGEPVIPGETAPATDESGSGEQPHAA